MENYGTFIFAKKGKLSEQQKAAIIDWIENNLFGEIALEPDSPNSEVEDFVEDYCCGEYRQEILEALRDGYTVHYDYVSFKSDCAEQRLRSMYTSMFNVIGKHSNGNISFIENDFV